MLWQIHNKKSSFPLHFFTQNQTKLNKIKTEQQNMSSNDKDTNCIDQVKEAVGLKEKSDSEKAQDKAGDAVQNVKDAAGHAVDAAKDQANNAKDSVVGSSEEKK